MGTIKIDRGFTQKIQHHALEHAPVPQPVPPQKKPQGPNKKAFLIGVAAAAIGVTVLAGIVAAVSAGGKGKKKPPAAAAPASAQPAPALAATPLQKAVPAAPERVSPAPLPEPPAAAPTPTPPPPSAPKQEFKPVRREITLGEPRGLLCEYYENISGKTVGALRSAPQFPGLPDRTVQVKHFELSENIGNQYGVRVRGYLVPSASGKYRFSVCADDAVELWLSADEAPAHVRKLVGYGSWVPKNQWAVREDQQSPECELKAGQRYYVEAFLKEESGGDYLAVAWKGPVSDTYRLIDAQYLQPWAEAAAAPAAAASQPNLRQSRETAQAPARAAIEEQRRKNGAAYRYAEAADALKKGKSAWTNPQAQALIETAVLRFELLGRLRAFLQAELAKGPVRGLWTAFGKPADITAATDEGVTVAPGRIVEWAKIPTDQMLKLVNALVPNAVADPATKGSLFLAAAVFNKETTGSLDAALKYRERALANNSGLSALADRVLDGSPDALQAEIRMKAARAELERAAAPAAGLAEHAKRLQAALADATGLVPGARVEYWDQNPYGNLDDARKKGLLKKQPDSVKCLSALEVPRDRAEKYVGRISAFLAPTETDDYYFYIAADDRGEFWLSPDETPAKLALVVKTDLYSSYRAWDKEKRRSKPVSLVKGRRYYLEAYIQEGEKSDHLSVAWSTVANDTPNVVGASNLLFSAADVFSPQSQALRLQIEADLQKIRDLLAESDKARAAERAWYESDQPASSAAADELQRQVGGVQESLRRAEASLKQTEAALEQLKAASRPG